MTSYSHELTYIHCNYTLAFHSIHTRNVNLRNFSAVYKERRPQWPCYSSALALGLESRGVNRDSNLHQDKSWFKICTLYSQHSHDEQLKTPTVRHRWEDDPARESSLHANQWLPRSKRKRRVQLKHLLTMFNTVSEFALTTLYMYVWYMYVSISADIPACRPPYREPQTRVIGLTSLPFKRRIS